MKYLICFLAIFLFSCSNEKPLTSEDKKEIYSAIETVMDQQAADWSAGDIDGFMEGYWKSDSLRFVGSRGITYGWEQTKNNYKKGYPDKAAMGKLEFDMKQLDVLTPDDAILLGGFTLFRSSDTLSGNFTLTWKQFDGKWLVTSDMTCG